MSASSCLRFRASSRLRVFASSFPRLFASSSRRVKEPWMAECVIVRELYHTGEDGLRSHRAPTFKRTNDGTLKTSLVDR
jgi:hypothetical protein